MDGSSAIVAYTIAEEPAVEDGSGRKKKTSHPIKRYPIANRHRTPVNLNLKYAVVLNNGDTI